MASIPRPALIAALLLPCWSVAMAESIEFFVNNPNDNDYTQQVDLPTGFGDGEFTFELWIRPNDSFPVGPTTGGVENTRDNWAEADNQPYGGGNWWFSGNFLLDGHNNGSSFSEGTFSLQFYGGGRVRWLFGDGSPSMPTGGLWSVGAYPATTTPSLLDGAWHQLTLVRRWSGASSADLEMYIDGNLIDSETSNVRTDMRQWWDNWNGFPGAQRGWFWGAEKQAAVGIFSQYEDYKGLVDEMRFWSRAKTAAEIASGFNAPVTGSETGLVGWYDFGEASGTEACDSLAPTECMALINTFPGVWNAQEAPLSGGTGPDTQAPTVPTGLQGNAISQSRIDLSWNMSSDNVAVTGYEVRRNGVLVDTVSGTSYSDTGLAANTSYSYTVAARDAAGNASAESAAVAVSTLPASDTEAPTVPSGLQGNASSQTRIDLSWNASSDNVAVTGYDLRRDGMMVVTVAGTSYSNTGLTPNTSYAYTAAARDAAGNVSAESGVVLVSTLALPDTESPTVPIGLQGNGVSQTRIDLTWNASSDNVGVTGYDVRRDGVVVATVVDTTFSDTGLTANTSYAYTVSARDDASNVSAESASVAASTLATPDTEAPSVPTGLQGNTISQTRIDLSWNASSDNVAVTGYDMRRDGVVVATVSGTSYSDTGLTANTSYSYTVAARDGTGNVSAESAGAVVATLAAPDTEAPTAPTGLQGNAVSQSRIDLNWNSSSDNVAVTGYDVRRDGAVVATVTGTNFSDTGLAANSSYSYTIAARDDAGNVSIESAPALITTNPATTVNPNPPANQGGGGGLFGITTLLLLLLTRIRRPRRSRPPCDAASP